MAAPNTALIIRVPSTVVFNGTTLGETRAIEFTPNQMTRPVWAEELGLWADVFTAGCKVQCKFTLRYPDSDALAAACPGSSGSSWTYNATGSSRAGLSRYASAGTLVITPRAASHPPITLQKAMLILSEAASLLYAWNREWGLEVMAYGTMDGSANVYKVG